MKTTKSILICALLFLALSCQKENAQTPDEIRSTSNAVQSGFVPYSVLYSAAVPDSALVVLINDAGSYPIWDTLHIEQRFFKSYLDQIDSIYTGDRWQWQIQPDLMEGFVQMRKFDLTAVPQ